MNGLFASATLIVLVPELTLLDVYFACLLRRWNGVRRDVQDGLDETIIAERKALQTVQSSSAKGG